MIIIANTLASNGGTTFLIRMAKEYYNSNKKIKVIVLYENCSKQHLSDLKEYADVFFIKNFCSRFSSYFAKSQLFPFVINLKRNKLNKLIKEESTIHVMGVFGFILAKRVQKIFPQFKITVGVYHQNEFMYNSIDCYFNNWLFNEMSCLNYKYFIFYNETMRSSYSRYFNPKFIESPLLPIGVSLNSRILVNRYKYGLIISVGNLVGFKTYNRHIVTLLPKILNKFPTVQYHIYGEGEEKENIQALIDSLNLNNHVFLMGRLDYNLFEDVVSKAHVFVGNGTAVLEAANAGVPSITGIESCELAVSYGYVSDIIGLDYNEYVPDKKTFEFEVLLNNLFAGNNVERERLVNLGVKSVKKFDISNTVTGFSKMNEDQTKTKTRIISSSEVLKLFFSFLFLSIIHVLKIDQRFKLRRNQGSILQ